MEQATTERAKSIYLYSRDPEYPGNRVYRVYDGRRAKQHRAHLGTVMRKGRGNWWATVGNGVSRDGFATREAAAEWCHGWQLRQAIGQPLPDDIGR